MPVRRHIDPAVDRRAKNSKDPVLNAVVLLVDEYKYTVRAGRTDLWIPFQLPGRAQVPAQAVTSIRIE